MKTCYIRECNFRKLNAAIMVECPDLSLLNLQRKISMTSTSVLGTRRLQMNLLHPLLPATQCVPSTQELQPSLKPICTVRTGHCGADMSPSRSTRTLPLRHWRCVRLKSTQVRWSYKVLWNILTMLRV